MPEPAEVRRRPVPLLLLVRHFLLRHLLQTGESSGASDPDEVPGRVGGEQEGAEGAEVRLRGNVRVVGVSRHQVVAVEAKV